MPKFRPVKTKVDLPAMEREVLEFWRRERIFERSIELRRGAKPWIFYEGPPTANGRPGIHHVEARVFKDVYPRFRTMTGYLVPRKAGWDCHGLPVELEVEKQIGTKSKRDIETFGIAEFNRLCRESVTGYVDEWERLTGRIGFWLDLDDAYWTMNTEYVESVWWSLKRLHEQGLLFKADRTVAYCPRCGTALSDHEVAQGYREVTDPSVYVKFPVTSGPDEAAGAALVGWTTTPWTLTSNLGLAVAADHTYVRAKAGGEEYVVAEPLLRASLGEEAEVVARFPGTALAGVRYSPPFANVDGDTHRVVTAGFVVMNEGTGIVHVAPGFGADDFELGQREGWPAYRPVDDAGRFTDDVPAYLRGRFVKEADPDIIEDLRTRGLLLRAEQYRHTYPHCWRCDTPLLYVARSSWYVRTTARKERLLEVNEGVNWYPDHIKRGRYGDWLENNIDWSLSRERYWGTPLPVWVCPQEHLTVVGSLSELSALAGRDLSTLDPHRPAVDEVELPCRECGRTARRVTEVIDAWYDSGAMPYAQWSYHPDLGRGVEEFEAAFPADFISEAIDQTRGWFYSLMAESVLLFDQNSYRNVVCLGHLVDRDGRKMSKRLGNSVDPWEVIDRYGADALRWFLVATGSPWSARRVYLEAIEDVVRRFLLTLWNTYAFFVTYANLDEPDLSAAAAPAARPPLDRWALSQLHGTAAFVREAMESYDATGAARRISELVDDLSNWYVRRSRRRFWDPARADAGGHEASADKLSAYATLHACLATIAALIAPFTPFLADELYRNLALPLRPDGPPSVHLTDFPVADHALVDPALDQAMTQVRTIVSLGRTVRTDAKVKVRQPLARAAVHVSGDRSHLTPLLPLVADELNVKDVAFATSAEELAGWRAKPKFPVLGPRLGGQAQEVGRALASDDGSVASALARGENVRLQLPSGEVAIGPQDVEVSQQARGGWAMASDGSTTVALDLELTDELRREGSVRELIRQVQDLRKAAGLEVSDRIVLGVSATDASAVAAALGSWRDRVAGEVLAVEVVDGTVPDPAASVEADVEGDQVLISLRKV
jgi:isoleucyl-tRNA synthetase